MAQNSTAQSEPITGINVTPLVDITLVLLIVFMLTAKLMVGQRALNADLPRAMTGERVQNIFSVALSADGRIALDGVVLAEDADVLARARTAQDGDGELRAVIQADAGVPHGRVMFVLDQLRQAGVWRIGFGVVPAPNEAPARGEH
jgi:biopolymer transport protein ExbD